MQHSAHLRNALVAAILTAILVAPVFGLQLVRQGVVTIVAPNWSAMALASALVFIVQLLRPFMRFAVSRVPRPRFAIVSFSRRPWLLAALLMLAAIWPFFSFAGRSAVDIGTLTLIYIILGLGLNIVVGYAGLLNLGYAGFYAVGAYTAALLYQWGGLGFWQSLPLAGAMAALFGLVLGFPVLRLRGDYLAIVTLGFGEIIRLLMINLVQWTGGPDGISGIPKPSFFGYEIARRSSVEGQQTLHQMLGMDFSAQHMVIYLYLIALALAVFTLWVSNRLVRMPIGRAWEALREDEIACRSLGLNPTGIKLSAFTIGAMFAGLAGAFFASRQGMVNPESFTFMESALVLSIVVLGGMGSQTGVIVAAILLTVLPEFARSFAEYRMLLFGLIMVLMMIWRPQGLIPMQRPHVALQEP